MANKENLIPVSKRSKSEARELGRKGGKASGEARREKKALRELMMEELQKNAGAGLTKAQYLVAKALENHVKGKLTFKDLKDLQDILGESVINVNHTGMPNNIIVRSKEEKRKIENIGNIGV